MTPKNPRSRFGTTRRTSGCTTCKYVTSSQELYLLTDLTRSRHLKCDETHPICQRCTSSRRRCARLTDAERDHSTSPLRIVVYSAQLTWGLSSQPAVAPRAARALEFFQCKTAPELEGALFGDAWSKLIIKACDEKAVLHAVIALSSLHERYKGIESSPDARLEFSMQHYSKAINEVVKLDFTTSSTATIVAMITCLLFTLFESLQGHYRSGLTHMQSGIKIINEHYTKPRAASKFSDDFALSVYLFKCLETQILELGDVGNLRNEYSSLQFSGALL